MTLRDLVKMYIEPPYDAGNVHAVEGIAMSAYRAGVLAGRREAAQHVEENTLDSAEFLADAIRALPPPVVTLDVEVGDG